jgi:hypothetical protein
LCYDNSPHKREQPIHEKKTQLHFYGTLKP